MNTSQETRMKDYLGSLLVIGVGLGAIFLGVSYQVGTLRAMGSGFFPVSVGVLLVFLGLVGWIKAALAARAAGARASVPKRLRAEWRGWICISLAVVAFAVLGEFTGLVPATFAIVFISALGDRHNSVLGAAVLAVSMCIVAVAVFWWALNIPIPLFYRG